MLIYSADHCDLTGHDKSVQMPLREISATEATTPADSCVCLTLTRVCKHFHIRHDKFECPVKL